MLIIFGKRFGKKHNISSEGGQCRLCGSFSNLKSYEANKYFHLYWIPLIPLGKKRVDSHCSKCDQYLETPYNDWVEMGQNSIERAKNNFENNLTDVDAAIEYYEVLSTYGDKSDAEKFKTFLNEKFVENEVLKNYFRATAEVIEPSADKVHQLKDITESDPEDENAKYSLGWSYFESEQFKKAYETLLSISNPVRVERDFYRLMILTDHVSTEESYEILKLLASKHPHDAQSHYGFYKLARKIESQLEVPADQSIISKKAQKKRRNKKYAPFIIVGAILLLAPIYIIYQYYHQKVYLVNGSMEPITIDLGNQKVIMNPVSYYMLEMQAGQYQVNVETHFNKRELELDISSKISDLSSNDIVYVINPNGAGIISWEEVVYSTNPNLNAGSYEFHTGEEIKVYRNIDYAFEDPPEEIEIDSHKSQVTKICLSFVDADPMIGSTLLMIYPDGHTPEGELNYMESHIRSNYVNEEYLMLYDSLSGVYGEKNRAEKFLKEIVK